MDNLKDHIDDPIKKVVVGLNLLGIPTAMFCCGFSYKNEAVPKSHLKKTYVYLKTDEVTNWKTVIELARMANWKIAPFTGAFTDFYAETWHEKHPWSDVKAVHEYEIHVLAISAMEKAIDRFILDFSLTATINDGNELYKKDNRYWQYEPAEPWIVTLETYNNL